MCDVSKAQMGFVVERYYQFSTQRSFSNSTPITTDLINNAAIKESIVLELDHFPKDISDMEVLPDSWFYRQ